MEVSFCKSTVLRNFSSSKKEKEEEGIQKIPSALFLEIFSYLQRNELVSCHQVSTFFHRQVFFLYKLRCEKLLFQSDVLIALFRKAVKASKPGSEEQALMKQGRNACRSIEKKLSNYNLKYLIQLQDQWVHAASFLHKKQVTELELSSTFMKRLCLQAQVQGRIVSYIGQQVFQELFNENAGILQSRRLKAACHPCPQKNLAQELPENVDLIHEDVFIKDLQRSFFFSHPTQNLQREAKVHFERALKLIQELRPLEKISYQKA